MIATPESTMIKLLIIAAALIAVCHGEKNPKPDCETLTLGDKEYLQDDVPNYSILVGGTEWSYYESLNGR